HGMPAEAAADIEQAQARAQVENILQEFQLPFDPIVRESIDFHVRPVEETLPPLRHRLSGADRVRCPPLLHPREIASGIRSLRVRSARRSPLSAPSDAEAAPPRLESERALPQHARPELARTLRA